MSGSGWSYFTGYQKDIAKAFFELRQHLFDTGQYAQSWKWGEEGSMIEASSIEDALNKCGSAGTHSLLDIVRITDNPNFYCNVPLSEDFLELFAQTEEPVREVIEPLVYHEQIWPLVQSRVEDYKRIMTFSPVSVWPHAAAEIVAFFQQERSLPDLVTALTENPRIWYSIYVFISGEINRIAREVVYRTALPVSEKELLRVFGTLKPTREAAQYEWEEGDLREYKNSACYLVTYEHDLPTEIFFYGWSGGRM